MTDTFFSYYRFICLICDRDLALDRALNRCDDKSGSHFNICRIEPAYLEVTKEKLSF